MIDIDCTSLDFDGLASLEWLETNGIGGYASSSIAGANTRRYHGLLTAATRPPLGRVVLLSKLEETLVVNGQRFDLCCNQYPNKLHPEGYRYLTRFRRDPFPVWSFLVAGVRMEKKLLMASGENTSLISWSAVSGESNIDVVLEVRPLIAFRDHHHLRSEDSSFDTGFQTGPGTVSVQPYPQMPKLYLANNAVSVEAEGYWYNSFEYRIEQERGFDFTEDLFQPFCLTFDLATPATVIASTEPHHIERAAEFEAAEIARRRVLVDNAGDQAATDLVLAADQFIVTRGRGKTVIAGYPWFSDWGRDTMIALPGLTLATGRPEIARSVLLEFSRHISQGMLPNGFPDAGDTPEYNTVDATLWFFEAIRAYAVATGDYETVEKSLYQKLAGIIEWHVMGTRYGIHVDNDGLLCAGERGSQLTWMDAKIGDWVVTPRTGKPVEIQTLWFNALCVMKEFAVRFAEADDAEKYGAMAEQARRSFAQQFWNEADQCLYDVVDGLERDASIRPNQIFAVSLPHSMLDQETARRVVDKVEAELLTPVGLRSLSPKDERYSPVYVGTPFDRDAAYHQGTVWGWLIGPFVDAYRRVHTDEPDLHDRAGELVSGLRDHVTEAMAGQVSEIFDGDHPHTPRGCPAQAWSVAELLRVTTSG